MNACAPVRTEAAKRYSRRLILFMTPYILICLAMMVTDLFDAIIGTPWAWLLALVVALPISGQVWAVMAFMKESDEFVRAVTGRQFIIAAGITLSLAAFWGFAENFGVAPHIYSWLILPVFYAVFGLVTPFVRSTTA